MIKRAGGAGLLVVNTEDRMFNIQDPDRPNLPLPVVCVSSSDGETIITLSESRAARKATVRLAPVPQCQLHRHVKDPSERYDSDLQYAMQWQEVARQRELSDRLKAEQFQRGAVSARGDIILPSGATTTEATGDLQNSSDVTSATFTTSITSTNTPSSQTSDPPQKLAAIDPFPSSGWAHFVHVGKGNDETKIEFLTVRSGPLTRLASSFSVDTLSEVSLHVNVMRNVSVCDCPHVETGHRSKLSSEDGMTVLLVALQELDMSDCHLVLGPPFGHNVQDVVACLSTCTPRPPDLTILLTPLACDSSNVLTTAAPVAADAVVLVVPAILGTLLLQNVAVDACTAKKTWTMSLREDLTVRAAWEGLRYVAELVADVHEDDKVRRRLFQSLTADWSDPAFLDRSDEASKVLLREVAERALGSYTKHVNGSSASMGDDLATPQAETSASVPDRLLRESSGELSATVIRAEL